MAHKPLKDDDGRWNISQLALMRGMGVDHVAQLPGSSMQTRFLVDMMGANGSPAMVLECGQHEDPESFKQAVYSILAFLRNAGALSEEAALALEQQRSDAFLKDSVGVYETRESLFHPKDEQDYLLLSTAADVRVRQQEVLGELAKIPADQRMAWLDGKQGDPYYQDVFAPIRNFDAYHAGDVYAVAVDDPARHLTVPKDGHMIMAPLRPLIPRDFPEAISMITAEEERAPLVTQVVP